MILSSAMRSGGAISATLFTTAAIAILVGLGIWQLERRIWKNNLVATVTTRIDRPPQDLPPSVSWLRVTPDGNEYAHVRFPAEFIEGQEALVYTSGSSLRPDVEGQGFWVFAPARLADGSIVLINRGFVPLDRKDPARRLLGLPRGRVEIVGYLRWPEKRGLFTPADDVNGNVWYVRDPQSMAETHRWAATAPFYIDQEQPVPSGGLPKPGKIDVKLPNNHLQYALTWFGLALAAAGVYAAWLAAHLRRLR